MTSQVAPEEVVFGDVLGPCPRGPDGRPNSSLPSPYRYTYQRYLGRGGYGLAYAVRRTSDGERLVVKILSLGAAGRQSSAPADKEAGGNNANNNANAAGGGGGGGGGQLPAIERTSLSKVHQEMAALQRISRHFGCTELVEGMLIDSHALLFLEYCDAGDLHQEISRMRRRNKTFTEDTAKIILLQLVFTLHHLHRQGMMHRDIKASNVLLCTCGLVKIGDFGLSKTVEVASTFCGTPTHLAPEVWERSAYGRKADIWSLGVVFYHCLAMRVPFTSRVYDQLRRQVCREEYPRLSSLGLSYSPELIALAERMMTRDPVKRPSTDELLREPILLRMIDRWPELINNSPVASRLRQKIMTSLIDDSILAPDPATGQLRSHPRLHEPPQPAAPAAASESSPTAPGGGGEGNAFVINEETVKNEEERDVRVSMRDEQANAERPEQDAAPAAEALSRSGVPAPGAAVAANSQAPAAAAANASPASPKSQPKAGDGPDSRKVSTKGSSTGSTSPSTAVATPSAGPPNANTILRKGLVWKAKSTTDAEGNHVTRWDPRGLILTPLVLLLFQVRPETAAALVYDGVDEIAAAALDLQALTGVQRLSVGNLQDVVPGEGCQTPLSRLGVPVRGSSDSPITSTGSAGSAGAGAQERSEVVYSVLLQRNDGKQFELGVSGRALRDRWVEAIRQQWDAAQRRGRDGTA